ncbi:hypothetical protein LDENG_00106920 [Lucifuga dentata]|nr:hypothetical protein LDENG_00106920 [Lucifuga dentata]
MAGEVTPPKCAEEEQSAGQQGGHGGSQLSAFPLRRGDAAGLWATVTSHREKQIPTCWSCSFIPDGRIRCFISKYAAECVDMHGGQMLSIDHQHSSHHFFGDG